MRWACEKSEAGHALAPARDEVALWSGWACSHCDERFKRPGDSDSYELPLMDSVDEVDELALMLDGFCAKDGWRAPQAWGRALETNGQGSPLAFALTDARFADVAQAIFELESDGWLWMCSRGGYDVTFSRMGRQALLAVSTAMFADQAMSQRASLRRLEAAAKLRDGWRPSKAES